jgi:preprotein translocase subunit SecE
VTRRAIDAAVRSRVEKRRQAAYLATSRRKGHSMARTNPVQFMQQVRAEVSKVVWPTRREVVMTTIMVFLLAAFMAAFFSIVDLFIRMGLEGVLNAFG